VHKEGADGILHIRCRVSDKIAWEARAKENNTDLSKWAINSLNHTDNILTKENLTKVLSMRVLGEEILTFEGRAVQIIKLLYKVAEENKQTMEE